MNECPECGGLIIEDVEDDDYTDRVYGFYCPGCGWSSDEADDEDNESCGNCGGTGGLHKSGCPEGETETEE